MAIRIELYRVMPKEYRFDGAGRNYPACDLQFGVDIDLNGDADAACLAAGALIRGLGPLYGGDRDKKIVAYVNGEKVAQFVGRIDGAPVEAIARLFEGRRPDAGDFEYMLRRERAKIGRKEFVMANLAEQPRAVSAEYLDGIREGRAWLRKYGADDAAAVLDNLERTARTFPAASPVGQMLRGERDFWRNQLKKRATR